MKQGGTIDFTQGHMLKKFISFVIPLVLTGVLQTLFNAADLVVAGRYAGENALAAVGATGSMVNLIIALAIGVSVGANIVASVFIGANDDKMVKKTVDTSVAAALICGVVCGLFGIVLARPLLELMDTPKNILDEAVVYFRIYFAGVPASMLYNFCASVLRAAGESKKPLIYLTVSGVSNVILNIVFVTQFNMGAAGVGLATALTQYLAAALVIRAMIKTNEVYKLTLKKFTPTVNILKRILTVGIPSGIQSMVFSFSNIIIQSSINSFGSVAVAGNSAASNIEAFVYVAMNAFSVASTTVVGQNIGAKQFRRIDKVLYEAGFLVAGVGIVLGVLVNVFGKQLAGLYCPESAEAVRYACIRLMHIGFPYFLCGIMEVFTGTLKSCGYAVSAMVISLICCCGVRIVWICTVFEAFKTIESIYISYLVTWLLAIIACIVLYLGYARKRLISMETVDNAV